MTRVVLALAVLALASCAEQAPAETPPAPAAETEDPRCWYGGCEGPFYSAAPVRFGRFEIGDRVDAMPADATTAGRNCDLAGEDGCVFTLPDGVEYLVVTNGVVRKRMPVPTSHPLPFGLRGDETQDELVRVTQNLVGAGARAEAPHGELFVSHDGTLGTLENPVWLYFILHDNGRLKEIAWHGPQTT